MSNPINVGLASFGMSGKVFHGPLLKTNPNFKVVSVMQRSPRGAEEYFPGTRIVKKFSGLASDPEIELLIVNTPDQTHYQYAREALEAGKHVVVEKPFTMTVVEGEELVRLAGEKGLILSVFHNRRWDGGALTVQEILKKGYLGRIVEFESHYDRFRNYIQEDTWKEDKKAG
ncbi:MAG TPA: Gfo/Idh/MocA family oxidoreductase, partial [Anseongella sp.]|nr:Gfo/Idh/MocA family oxidoreductase [Anseongella sp.]